MCKWIPTKDRLPEEQGEYLVAWMPLDKRYCANRQDCFLEVIEFSEGEWAEEISQADGGYEVYAWMPLPKLYRINEQLKEQI